MVCKSTGRWLKYWQLEQLQINLWVFVFIHIVELDRRGSGESFSDFWESSLSWWWKLNLIRKIIVDWSDRFCAKKKWSEIFELNHWNLFHFLTRWGTQVDILKSCFFPSSNVSSAPHISLVGDWNFGFAPIDILSVYPDSRLITKQRESKFVQRKISLNHWTNERASETWQATLNEAVKWSQLDSISLNLFTFSADFILFYSISFFVFQTISLHLPSRLMKLNNN